MEPKDATDALTTQNEDGLRVDRGEMYARYLQSTGQEPPKTGEKPPETPAEGENKSSEKDVKTAEQPPKQADTGAKPPEKKADEEGEKPAEGSKKEKLVPYASLKEERVKRQELGTQVNDLKGKVEQLMRDNIALMSMLKGNAKPPDAGSREDVGEYDDEILHLKNKVQTLEKRDASRNEEKIQAEIKAYYDDGIKKMESVNADLEKEGFPGFMKFEHLVGQYFGKLKQDDPDEFEAMYNPEGWKQVYKEHIFPEISKLFGGKADESKKKEKVGAKEKANLASGPGTPPPGKGEEQSEGKTPYDEYLEMRRKSGIT